MNRCRNFHQDIQTIFVCLMFSFCRKLYSYEFAETAILYFKYKQMLEYQSDSNVLARNKL